MLMNYWIIEGCVILSFILGVFMGWRMCILYHNRKVMKE